MSRQQTPFDEKQVRLALKSIEEYTEDYTSSQKCDEIMHLLADGHATPVQEEMFKEHAKYHPEDKSCLELYLTIRKIVKEKAAKHYQKPVPIDLTDEILTSVQKPAKAS